MEYTTVTQTTVLMKRLGMMEATQTTATTSMSTMIMIVMIIVMMRSTLT